jgi:site-specific recombinase XerD
VAVATLPNFLFPAQPIQNANDEIIEQFVAYLRTKGLAPLTIEAYRSDLASCRSFLADGRL